MYNISENYGDWYGEDFLRVQKIVAGRLKSKNDTYLNK